MGETPKDPSGTTSKPNAKSVNTTETEKEETCSTLHNYEEIKAQIIQGLIDFKNVFFYPLCTGIMTGVGFIAGKRLGERYFYGSQKPS